MKSHGSMVLQKLNDSFLETILEVTEYWDILTENFKKRYQEETHQAIRKLRKEFKEIRHKISEQSEHFTKEIETLEKNQTEILELKNSINKTKNTLESSDNRDDHKKRELVSAKIEILKWYR